MLSGRFKTKSFPNILVPAEAYPFLRAMDELLGELAKKAGQKCKRKGWGTFQSGSILTDEP
jgi:hypothetical protein